MIARGAGLVALCALLLLACGSPSRGKLSLQAAPAQGEVAPFVSERWNAAKQQKRQLLVYVGAKWCEPCKRFHEAAQAGLFDQAFPQLDLVEFDLDRDEERLRKAGYVSQYIPLFARPQADGRGSGRQFAGSYVGVPTRARKSDGAWIFRRVRAGPSATTYGRPCWTAWLSHTTRSPARQWCSTRRSGL